jgi:hypothetical protein
MAKHAFRMTSWMWERMSTQALFQTIITYYTCLSSPPLDALGSVEHWFYYYSAAEIFRQF